MRSRHIIVFFFVFFLLGLFSYTKAYADCCNACSGNTCTDVKGTGSCEVRFDGQCNNCNVSGGSACAGFWSSSSTPACGGLNTCTWNTSGSCIGSCPGGDPDPSPAASPSFTTIGGLVRNATTGAGIAGVSVQVYDHSNGMQTRIYTTDASGRWSTSTFVRNGDYYAVRLSGNIAAPQTAPSGYTPPGRTYAPNSWTWDVANFQDTLVGSQSFENQQAGNSDCGSNSPIGDDRCSFEYTPIPGADILGRIQYTDARGVVSLTRYPGSQGGQPPICSNATQLDKTVTVAGSNYQANLCNSGGPLYGTGAGAVPVGNRTISVNSSSGQTITWSCSQDIGTGACPAGSGPGTSFSVNLESNDRVHAWFYVSCPAISAPANFRVTPICSATAGNYQATVSWNAVPNTAFYSLRINDLTNGWDPDCSPINPGDHCLDVSGTSYNFTVVPGRNYNLWIHSRYTCNLNDWSFSSTTDYMARSCIASPLPSPLPSPAPTPQGTIQARAVLVNEVNPTCTQVKTAPASTFFGNVQFTVSAVNPPPAPVSGTQTSAAYVSWLVNANEQYRISAQNAPPGYVLRKYCYQRGVGPFVEQATMNLPNLQPGETVIWDVAYGLPLAWFQAVGGNVHTNNIYSLTLPVGEYFIEREVSNSGQNSGIASYNGNVSGNSIAGGTISQSGYLVPESGHYDLPSSLYSYYRSRFNASLIQTVTSPVVGVPSGATAQEGVEIYEAPPGATIDISSGWNIGSGTKKIIFVNGNLRFANNLANNSKIQVAPGGFLAFIVSGNIVVAPEIGTVSPVTQVNDKVSEPYLTGIFIADQAFRTPSGAVPDRQFIGAGTFVSEQFELGRNVGQNDTHPSELFVYRPDLWVNAPLSLKEINLNWQELVP